MSNEKHDPLQGIEEPERTWLIEIAEREGMTIADVVTQRSKVAAQMGEALEPYREPLQEQAVVERRVTGVLKAVGINAAGFWSAMKYSETGAAQGRAASDGGKARADLYAHDYQAALERVMNENPRWGVTTAREEVASEFGVSPKTVERRTTNPRK